MEVVIDRYEELINKIKQYSDSGRYIFRGQVKNYFTSQNLYSFQTSFERNECIPTLKAKWEYYCYNALKGLLGSEQYKKCSFEQMLIYVEALLQHYGWRSVYLDVSKDINISLFFAGHTFNMRNEYMATEDFQEEFLFEVINNAYYEESNFDYGYLYIIDKEIIVRDKNTHFIDLTESILDVNTRPVRQKGCLISTFPLPINTVLNTAIIEVLKIKKSLIINYCKNEGIKQTTLFPNNEEDFIYDFLLSLPRKEFVDNEGHESGFFLKQLSIPEYGVKIEKFKSPSVAYFSTFWILDNLEKFGVIGNTKNPYVGCVYYKCIDDCFYHWFSKEGNYLQMPHLIRLIREKEHIVLEFDNIFRHYSSEQMEYQKGIRFKLIDNMIQVTEIIVSYAGKSILGIGELTPRYYEIISDEEVVIKRVKDDCPCDDDDRHLHKLLVGKYFAQMIDEGYIHPKNIENNSFLINN